MCRNDNLISWKKIEIDNMSNMPKSQDQDKLRDDDEKLKLDIEKRLIELERRVDFLELKLQVFKRGRK
jgi:hypothetical protein